MKMTHAKFLLFLTICLLCPNNAFAHGDPILVYTVFFFPMIHFFGFVYIIISKYRFLFKIIAAPLFFILTAFFYYFGLNSKDDLTFYMGMGVLPTTLYYMIFLFRGPKVKTLS